MIVLLAPPGGDRTATSALLTARGHEVRTHDVTAPDPEPAGPSTVLLLDLAAGPDALRFLRRHAGQSSRAPVVCLAHAHQTALASEALRLGAIDIVARPIQPEDLETAIANARELARLHDRSDVPSDPPDLPSESVFGASPAMRDVLTLVRRLAPSRCAVLIVGERGTGREMVARAIHRQGPRNDRAFVKIACDAATDAEIAWLLGASLPAEATVYLENLADLPPDVQSRLEDRLRAVSAQPGREPALRVRFIAGALPRLPEWIEQGKVRRGLIDALSVVRVDLPPLRQRSADIPLLALHFLKESCRANGVAHKAFSRAALALLAALPWPGNASELRSLCERLAVLVPRGVVLLEDVLANVRLDTAETLGRRDATLREARERFERDYVTAALQHHRGRMGAAARELGIERTNLYRKIKQLNIRWNVPRA